MARLLLLVVLLASSTASAQDGSLGVSAAPAVGGVRVAIVPGIAVNLETARVDAISQDLADALMAQLDVVAIGGLEVRRQLPADGVPPDCVATPACIEDVAKRTGANQLLFVVMVDSGVSGSIQVDATWVDPASKRSVSRPALDLTSATEAKVKFEAAARQLLPDAPVRGRPPHGDADRGVTPSMTEGAPRHFTRHAMITAAVGVVGLGFGIAFGMSTASRYDTCQSDPFSCTGSDRDSIRTRGVLADMSFVIAAGAAVATVVLYMTSSEAPRLIVTPTSDGAAVGAFGRF